MFQLWRCSSSAAMTFPGATELGLDIGTAELIETLIALFVKTYAYLV